MPGLLRCGYLAVLRLVTFGTAEVWELGFLGRAGTDQETRSLGTLPTDKTDGNSKASIEQQVFTTG